ncbi:MAG: Ig-like domain-containing protein, partial [Idiomarina sp.]|nr:Ig-like domain-containing protein [Idiomarina sp.]
MRPKIFNSFSPKKWLTLAFVSTFLIACGDNGRDPILGNDGNAALAPTVIAVTPANNATNVTVTNPTITATFSESMTPLTNSDFTLTCATPCAEVSGSITMNAANTVATYMLDEPAMLDEQTLYFATIENATSQSNGIALAQPFAWEFTTGMAPDTTRPQVTSTEPVTSTPGPTINVPVNALVSAVFSEAMTASTITDTSFTVTCEAPCVNPAGQVSYD